MHIEGFAQEYYDETELVVDAGGVLDVTGSGRVTVDSLSAIPSQGDRKVGPARRRGIDTASIL
ncbi:hypothetical protein LBMAG42_57330 [Deltaproteobacteria bacterium]|nr:hypothetical protein LBMAG42_57330 [Deltaproteobacteria bacterium]